MQLVDGMVLFFVVVFDATCGWCGFVFHRRDVTFIYMGDLDD